MSNAIQARLSFDEQQSLPHDITFPLSRDWSYYELVHAIEDMAAGLTTIRRQAISGHGIWVGALTR